MRVSRMNEWMTALLLGLLLALSACATPNAVIGRSEKVKAMADEARTKMDDIEEYGGPRCGVKELAIADAQYAFAKAEISQGEYSLVLEHVKKGEENGELALLKARACEVPDRDHDGLIDEQDQCPDDAAPGTKSGCPVADKDHDGFPDDLDKCPDEPEDYDGYQDEDGCPEPDNDSDAIPDEKDQCPNDAEDKDGFQDEDGCPDPDNDRDGVPDSADKCPKEPQTYGADTPLDGCPVKSTYSMIEITSTSIEIKQMVYFATNKDVILAKSFPMLNEVAKALQDNPNFKIEIGGHTDNRGSAALNKKLSQRRAESVRRYLTDKGKVNGARITAVGYGDSQPIATNQTQVGRDKNRRVEFKIVGH